MDSSESQSEIEAEEPTMPTNTSNQVAANVRTPPQQAAILRERRQAFIRAWRIANARCYAYLRWRMQASAS